MTKLTKLVYELCTNQPTAANNHNLHAPYLLGFARMQG